MEISLDFEAFYRSEYERVYRAAVLAAPEPGFALDATQEAFEKAFARWRRLSKKQWAGGWVMTTALNLCRKEHRRRGRVRPGEFPEGSAQLSSATVEMSGALAKLPTRQREAVTLFYVGDLSIHAIAEVMNISDGGVKAHLSHGRKRLRELLDG